MREFVDLSVSFISIPQSDLFEHLLSSNSIPHLTEISFFLLFCYASVM